MPKPKVAPGEHKILPNGEELVLDTGPSGKNRWIQPNRQQSEGRGTGMAQQQGQGTPAPIIEDYKPPTMIDREEWIEYNEYLTVDNPFLNITSYEEGIEIWYQNMYDLQERIEIVRNQYERSKAEPGLEPQDINKQLSDIEDAMIKLSNQFIAIQCYKMCLAIHRIEYFNHSFDYAQKQWGWKEIMDYLEMVENGENPEGDQDEQ
jgi:hypothetical protein